MTSSPQVMTAKNIYPILICMILLSCTAESDLDRLFTNELTDQKVSKRTFVNTEDIQSLSSDLINPQRLIGISDGFVALDYGNDFRVIRYNWELERLNEFSISSGEGPGEIGAVSDAAIIAERLYLADVSNAVVHSYDMDGVFNGSFSVMDSPPLRISPVTDEHAFIMTPFSSAGNLEGVYSLEGTLLNQTGNITRDDVLHRLILESELASNSNSVFRAPQYFGLLIKYDNDGEVASARKMIDGFYTAFEGQGSGDVENPLMFDRNDLERAVLRIKATDTHVCTLIIKDVGHPDRERVTDCYDVNDLDYLFSLDTPDGTQDFVIDNDLFITLQDTLLTVKNIKWDDLSNY